MATSTTLETSIRKLRTLFTAAERKLLDSSTGKKLATASEREVKDLLRQCRTLRDKWRDLVGAQARTVKRTSKRVAGSRVIAATPTNERSRQKHSLFGDVVAHIESHLAGLTGQSSATPTAKQPVAKKAAPVRAAAKKTSSATSTGSSARAATTAAKARTVSRKARQAGAIKALESSTLSGLRTTAAKQRKASAALKAERLKLKGVTTRRAGHAKVQGGRSQARRDGRNAQR